MKSKGLSVPPFNLSNTTDFLPFDNLFMESILLINS